MKRTEEQSYVMDLPLQQKHSTLGHLISQFKSHYSILGIIGGANDVN